ncbi:CAP domain-containing protein [Ciceribacter sp. L1K23]|uniref:CAP domain-containing protein n=1 Tax=Ciceribacter sp. L1K23 TaxID=2820276 RepID=UPI001B83A5E9|nr:CAP domain-containing protein [Ciceribacter sp. L1K23]MBR0557122.1 CAP domain-containing protein [Ciceribacter sp. L1K23]
MDARALLLPSRRRLLILGGSLLATGLASCRSTDILPTGDDLATRHTDEALPMVNALRKKSSLPELTKGEPAEVAAVVQARRMAAAGKMAHLLSPNDSFLDRMKAGNVPLPAAENVAAGQDSVSRAVQAWIDSARHRENMLGSYTALGVAVAHNPSSGGRPYWAMVLSS